MAKTDLDEFVSAVALSEEEKNKERARKLKEIIKNASSKDGDLVSAVKESATGNKKPTETESLLAKIELDDIRKEQARVSKVAKIAKERSKEDSEKVIEAIKSLPESEGGEPKLDDVKAIEAKMSEGEYRRYKAARDLQDANFAAAQQAAAKKKADKIRAAALKQQMEIRRDFLDEQREAVPKATLGDYATQLLTFGAISPASAQNAKRAENLAAAEDAFDSSMEIARRVENVASSTRAGRAAFDSNLPEAISLYSDLRNLSYPRSIRRILGLTSEASNREVDSRFKEAATLARRGDPLASSQIGAMHKHLTAVKDERDAISKEARANAETRIRQQMADFQAAQARIAGNLAQGAFRAGKPFAPESFSGSDRRLLFASDGSPTLAGLNGLAAYGDIKGEVGDAESDAIRLYGESSAGLVNSINGLTGVPLPPPTRAERVSIANPESIKQREELVKHLLAFQKNTGEPASAYGVQRNAINVSQRNIREINGLLSKATSPEEKQNLETRLKLEMEALQQAREGAQTELANIVSFNEKAGAKTLSEAERKKNREIQARARVDLFRQLVPNSLAVGNGYGEGKDGKTVYEYVFFEDGPDGVRDVRNEFKIFLATRNIMEGEPSGSMKTGGQNIPVRATAKTSIATKRSSPFALDETVIPKHLKERMKELEEEWRAGSNWGPKNETAPAKQQPEAAPAEQQPEAAPAEQQPEMPKAAEPTVGVPPRPEFSKMISEYPNNPKTGKPWVKGEEILWEGDSYYFDGKAWGKKGPYTEQGDKDFPLLKPVPTNQTDED